jgi:hypothetical protein
MVLGVESDRRARLTLPPSVSLLPKQCGRLDVRQPYRTPRPVTWIALLSLRVDDVRT